MTDPSSETTKLGPAAQKIADGLNDAIDGRYHTTGASRIAHQTSIMVLTCLLGQFAEQMHPNMLNDVRWAIEGNAAALKEIDHAN